MLNIPDNIKNVLHGDSSRKNLRIHFPNGEFDDITNDNIIEESLDFTESICSSNVIEIGLAESSVLKFTCANIQNFKGKTIEAYLEVYSGDDYYSLPLGTFVVDECKRNSDMITRDVVAYSASGVIEALQTKNEKGYYNDYTTFEGIRRSVPAFSSSYPFDNELKKWIVSMCSSSANQNETYSDMLTPEYLSDTSESESVEFHLGGNWYYSLSLGGSVSCYFFKNKAGTPTGAGSHIFYDAQGLYAYKQDYDIAESIEYMDYAINHLSGFHINKSDKKLHECIREFGCKEVIKRRRAASTNAYNEYVGHPFLQKSGYIYPYIRGTHTVQTSYAGYTILYIYRDITVEIYELSDRGEKINSQEYGIQIHPGFYLYQVDTSEYSELDNINLSFARKAVATNDYRTVLPDDFTNENLVRSYAELSGAFGTFNRTTGNLEFKEFSDFGTYHVDPSHIEEIRYDDEQKEYTSVHATYVSGTTENEYAVVIKENADTNPYTIDNNYLLKNGYLTAAQVQTFINAIADKISTYKYIPCNITMAGAPHMEAGDTLEITLVNGEVISIPVLRRTLRGIHVLKDTIDII